MSYIGPQYKIVGPAGADGATGPQGPAGPSDISVDTTPQLGGDLDTNSNDINFADNDKAQFGAGNDLQIYHDGSHSRIAEAGTGDLKLGTSGGAVRITANGVAADMIVANQGGSVTLAHSGTTKLATTSTGIDVTGSVEAAGGDGGAKIGAWPQNSTFAFFGSANMTGAEYAIITNGTNTYVGSGTGGATHIRGPVNDETPEIVVSSSTVSINGGAFTSRGIDDNATATAMTLDSSGNILVGQTSYSVNNGGVRLRQDGEANFSRDGQPTLFLNRITSDGEIARFTKDGTTVGNIGVSGGDLTIHGDVGIRFSGDDVRPLNSSGSQADNAVDLGHHDVRWQDLYLSGGIYLGGTGASNHYDDYEEGEFTVTTARAGTTGDDTIPSFTAQYVKIGRMVFIDFTKKGSTSPYTRNGTGNYSSGQSVTITSNLPFTPNSSNSERLGWSRALSDYDRLAVGWRNGSTTMYLGTGDDNNYVAHNSATTSTNQSNVTIQCQFCYFTTA